MVNQECAQVRNPHETVVFARAIVIGGLAKRMKKVSKGLNIAAYLDTIATTLHEVGTTCCKIQDVCNPLSLFAR